MALLRAISNVPMEPFRAAMEELGYADVSTYGMSGNLLFNTHGEDLESIARRVAGRFGTEAIVRVRSDLTRIVGHPATADRTAVLLLRSRPGDARRRAVERLEFDPPAPVLHGRTVYYRYPPRLQDTRSPFDFERALGVAGTARSSRVLEGVLRRMEDD